MISPTAHRRPSAAVLSAWARRTYGRVLRPGLATIMPPLPAGHPALRHAFDQLDRARDDWYAAAKLAA